MSFHINYSFLYCSSRASHYTEYALAGFWLFRVVRVISFCFALFWRLIASKLAEIIRPNYWLLLHPRITAITLRVKFNFFYGPGLCFVVLRNSVHTFIWTVFLDKGFFLLFDFTPSIKFDLLLRNGWYKFLFGSWFPLELHLILVLLQDCLHDVVLALLEQFRLSYRWNVKKVLVFLRVFGDFLATCLLGFLFVKADQLLVVLCFEGQYTAFALSVDLWYLASDRSCCNRLVRHRALADAVLRYVVLWAFQFRSPSLSQFGHYEVVCLNKPNEHFPHQVTLHEREVLFLLQIGESIASYCVCLAGASAFERK